MRYLFITWMCLCLSVFSETVVEVSPTGAFKTLIDARDEIRRLKKMGRPAPYRVIVREGHYVMEQGLVLTSQDSDLLVEAAAGEKPRFFGGIIIQPTWFERVEDPLFLSRLVDKRAAQKIRVLNLRKHGIHEYGRLSRHGWSNEPKDRIPPASLLISGERMILSRWPNLNEENPYMVYQHYLPEPRELRGYELKVQEVIEKVRLPGEVTYRRVVDPGGALRKNETGGGTFEVAFDRMKHWHAVEDVWLDGVLGSTWEWTYNRISSVNLAKRQITLAYPELGGVGVGASVRLPHFYFENIAEEMDRPGEYYLDRDKGLLYIYPPHKKGVIVLSSLADPMVSILNASHIRFKGLEFDTGRNLAFKINKSSDITVDQCGIANFAVGGVALEGNDIRIINCHLRGLGGFGVSMQGGDAKTLDPARNEVVNCHIHDFGWDQKSQLPGIMVDGVGHRIAHCEIHDGPHFAIRIKGKNDILVEYNEIYDLPKYHKFDGGALYVYTGPRAESRGIVIRGNYFHNIPTIGAYPDNFSWGVEISHNLFWKVGVETGRPPIYNNGGGEGRVFNNMAVDCVQLYGQGARPKEDRWFSFWNRTIEEFGNGKVEQTPYAKYTDFKQWLRKKDKEEFFRPRSDLWNNVLFHPNHDIHLDASARTLKPSVLMRRIKNPGIIDHSQQLRSSNNWTTKKDPGFVDYKSGNFMLRSNALVFKKVKGFEPIPFEKMGRRNKPVL